MTAGTEACPLFISPEHPFTSLQLSSSSMSRFQAGFCHWSTHFRSATYCVRWPHRWDQVAMHIPCTSYDISVIFYAYVWYIYIYLYILWCVYVATQTHVCMCLWRPQDVSADCFLPLHFESESIPQGHPFGKAACSIIFRVRLVSVFPMLGLEEHALNSQDPHVLGIRTQDLVLVQLAP